MANLITTALTYSQESARDYIYKPLFVESDITSEITVITDVKSSKKLNLISALSGITKAYAQGSSFTSASGVTITQKTLTVTDLKAEVQQNGKAFKDFVGQALLKKGYAENDIQGTEFEQIISELFMKALKSDLQTQVWFGDPNAETTSSSVKTGTADTFMNVYKGFWQTIIDDFTAGTIAAAQRVTMSNGAVAQVDTITLTGTAGTATVTIAGKTYTATFATDLTTTAANFVTTHGAALLLRDITVTSGTAKIILTSSVPGVSFGVSAIANATGNLAGSRAATTANTTPSALTTDEAYAAFEDMVEAMPNELAEYKMTGDLRIYATRSMVENYKQTLRKLSNGQEAAYTAVIDGIPRLLFDGIPVIEKANWDTIISTKFPNQYPHRALLTTPENLVFGTDGSADGMSVEMFYDAPTQNNYFRVEYKGGTQYIHEKLVVAAY